MKFALVGCWRMCSAHIMAQSRGVVRVNQRPIMCRRSSRQCIARLIRLRSTLHPPPGSGSLPLDSAPGEFFDEVDCELALGASGTGKWLEKSRFFDADAGREAARCAAGARG
jgi:hypothetical protein